MMRAAGRVTPSRSPFLLRLVECRRRRVLSQRRRRVILAPALVRAACAPACSRAKRRCGAIPYHGNKPQHLNPCSWSSPEGAVGILSSGGNATQIVRRPSRAPPGARQFFARSGRRKTEAHELPDRLGEGGHAFAFAPVDGCLVVVFLESEADEDASPRPRRRLLRLTNGASVVSSASASLRPPPLAIIC